MSLDITLLRQMITQDSAAISQLKHLLAQERILLEQRKQDELPQIIEQKAILVEQLNNSAKQRQQILNTLGLPANANGWDLFLQRNAATLPLCDEWKILVSEFEDCQKMNDINGKMIARSQQTLSHLLGLLRGKVAAPALYNAQGAKTQHTSSYTVAKA
ncbi:MULTISPECIES: flagellar protein FlgN [Cellvibrio]|jgi:flagella synthesis protein FlgN|uniref:Flagella synthesis protein FlgN n=1 Tax=Cellvibrio fibrivorans TaxID=126350 RepID=A0ABU1UW35_9GAMM|nr:flagellar protein FlgN [Cellvibrio fibrivorans]MDR7089396.1 flagella synthesis protein FlgN [Cellvibrio fibrivorans]